MICVLEARFSYFIFFRIRYGIKAPQFKVKKISFPLVCNIKFNRYREKPNLLSKKLYPEEWIISFMQNYLRQN